MIEAVVFDMDEVLCRYRIERRLALLASWSGRSQDAIHAAIWRSGFEDEAERGVWTADAYLREFGERLGYPLSAAQWVAARRAAMEPDEGVLAIARRLSRPRGRDVTNNPLREAAHRRGILPYRRFGARRVRPSLTSI
jgi:putative hydrolase of the HAD superfamily